MVDLDKKMLKKLTKLSRIECNEAEEEELFHQLKAILEHVAHLQEVDTDDVSPCNHVLASICNVIREDEVGPLLKREDFLNNSPSQVGGMIRVPPVIKTQVE